MNISRATTNRTPFRTTRSKSSCAQMTDSVKQSSFGEVLKEAAPAKDTFKSTSAAERTPATTSIASSVPDTQAKLDKISGAIKNTDYSEMSKTETYADIERKYADSFDDFYMSLAFSPSNDHIIIRQQFLEDVSDHIGSMCIPLDFVHEARGYSGMSYDGIEAAIYEKYAGKTGFIDQLNLVGELFSSGVLSNKFGDDAVFLIGDLENSIECGYNGIISKNEWLSKIDELGVSSPFSLLINNPYYAEYKEKYQSMVDDILFGIMDKTQ